MVKLNLGTMDSFIMSRSIDPTANWCFGKVVEGIQRHIWMDLQGFEGHGTKVSTTQDWAQHYHTTNTWSQILHEPQLCNKNETCHWQVINYKIHRTCWGGDPSYHPSWWFQNIIANYNFCVNFRKFNEPPKRTHTYYYLICYS